jgi:hypothetical protein
VNKRIATLCLIVLANLCLWAGLVSGCRQQTVNGQPQQVVTQPLTSHPITESSQTTAMSATEVVWEMLGEVNQDRALSDLRRLPVTNPFMSAAASIRLLTGSLVVKASIGQ